MNVPFREASVLRRKPAEAIITEESERTGRAFRYIHGSVPVVIAAHNEELDLPATLSALAESDHPVYPIVVSNGSRDKTAEISDTMGAYTIELDTPAKMQALQVGTRFAHEELGDNTVLYTDADTIVSETWATAMKSAVEPREDVPVAASTSVLRWHGTSLVADAAKALWALRNELRRQRASQLPKLDGPSMAINFTDEAYKDYVDIDPLLFFHEEEYIRDLILSLGGVALHVEGEVVVSRGDRTESLLSYVRQRGNIEAKIATYRHSYGDGFVPYRPTEGFSRQHQMSAEKD